MEEKNREMIYPTTIHGMIRLPRSHKNIGVPGGGNVNNNNSNKQTGVAFEEIKSNITMATTATKPMMAPMASHIHTCSNYCSVIIFGRLNRQYIQIEATVNDYVRIF